MSPNRQMELRPPDDLSDPKAIVRRKAGTDEYPAWIGYPFQRAGKGDAKVFAPNGKVVTVPHNYYEKCLTLRFSDGEKAFTAVAFDAEAKCAVYVMDEVYDVPENQPVIMLEGTMKVDDTLEDFI